MYRTQKIYKIIDNEIKDEDIFPILIPSYSRPDAMLLKKLAGKGLPVYVFIRREQKNLYREYKGVHKFVFLDGVQNIGQTRAKMVEWAWEHRIPNVFMLDDDIYSTDFLFPGITSGGNECLRPRCANEGTGYDINPYFFKMWQYYLKRVDKKVAISAAGGKGDWWNISNTGAKVLYNSGSIIQCIHLNTRLLYKHKINYRDTDEVGVEDYALQYDVFKAGLLSWVNKDLVYECPSIGTNSGGCNAVHQNTLQERYKKHIELFMNNVVQPEDEDKFTTKVSRAGVPSVKFRWNKWRITTDDSYTERFV